MKRAVIRGTGMYAPERVVRNEEFNEMYGRDLATFLVETRNIRERRFMSSDQATSDLVVPAARQALANAGLSVDEVDLIIVATDTPDYVSPATAAVVQHKLGATRAAAFDVNAAGAGFVTALDMAGKYLGDPQYKTILVVGAYGMSKYLNYDDPKITTLFADGAGVVVVQGTDDAGRGFDASTLFTDGRYHDGMGVYAGGTFRPVTHEVIEMRGHLLEIAKSIPDEAHAREWPRLARVLLDRTKRRADQIDHVFLPQIDIGAINAALDTLGLERTKCHNIMDRFGYTGSACVPMALHDAVEQGKLKKGDLVVLLGSGGGLSMGALSLTWDYDT